MMIEVIGKIKADRYRAFCPNTACGTIIEFHKSDIKHGSFFEDNKIKSYEGIRCPDCQAVIEEDTFVKLSTEVIYFSDEINTNKKE